MNENLWQQLEEQVIVENDVILIRDKIAEAKKLASTDPDESVNILTGLYRDIQDALTPIDVFCSHLNRHVDSWAEISTKRLVEKTNTYFSNAKKHVIGEIDRKVRAHTQFTEVGHAIKDAYRQKRDKLKFSSAVKRFFVMGRDEPQRNQEWKHLQNCLEFRSYLLEEIARRHGNKSPSEPLIYEERSRISSRIRELEYKGRQRYKTLKETGFFDAQPHDRLPILRNFDHSLIDSFKYEGWLPSDPEVRPSTSLLGQLLDQHFGEKAMESFRDRFLEEETEELKAFWSNKIKEAADTVPSVSFNLTKDNEDGLESQVSAKAAAAMAAMLAPVVAVGVLAAGWHTLTWAMLNLFPPMLLVALPVAIWAFVTGKATTKRDMKKQANVFCESLLNSQIQSVRKSYRKHTEIAAKNLVDAVIKNAVMSNIGMKYRNYAVRLLEQIQKTCASLNPARNQSIPDFLAMAGAALERKEAYMAAAMAIQAYEVCIERWLGKLGIERPRGTDHLRKSIDLLITSKGTPLKVAGRFRRLRPVRNRWAHGMRDLAELSESERCRRVREFLNTLGAAAG